MGAAADCLSQPQDYVADSYFDQSLASIAAFGQATYHLNDAWKVTLGGRWTKDEKRGIFEQILNNSYASAIRTEEQVLDMRRDDSKPTWFANTSYAPTDNMMVFATFSSGYKSGGFNSEGAGFDMGRELRIFGPEESSNIEVGMKSNWLDNSLMANVTVYRTEIEGFQDRSFDGLSYIVKNAGEVRQQGIEADFIYQPLDELQLTAGFSYLDSEFLSFKSASPLPGATEFQDLTGSRKHFAPEWQGSLVAHWESSLTDSLNWYLRGESQYMGEQNIGANTNGNPQSIQEAYTLVNLRAGVRDVADQWQVALFGKNLSDEGYCLTMFDQPIGSLVGGVNAEQNTSVQRCIPGAPKTAGVEVQYRF
nr:TonB-dependent receptor [Microbulbifer sp. GX H0434]